MLSKKSHLPTGGRLDPKKSQQPTHFVAKDLCFSRIHGCYGGVVLTTPQTNAISKVLMRVTNEEARKTLGIKLRPSIVRKARIGAASSDKRLGAWLEEAIEEKLEREQRARRPQYGCGFEYFGFIKAKDMKLECRWALPGETEVGVFNHFPPISPSPSRVGGLSRNRASDIPPT